MIKTNNKLLLRKSRLELPSSMGGSCADKPQPWNFKYLTDGYLSGLDLIYLGKDIEFEIPEEPFKLISDEFFEYEIKDFIVSKEKILFSQHPDFEGLMNSVWEGWYPHKKLTFKSGRYKFKNGQPIARVSTYHPTYFAELSEAEIKIIRENISKIDGIIPLRPFNRYEMASLSPPPSKKIRIIR